MLSSIMQKASGLSESFQVVQERLPESLQSMQNAKAGASKVHDDLAAKIGTVRKIKTPQGTKEVVEICLLGDSPNVTKVRCMASDKEFALKRMSIGNQNGDQGKTGGADNASAMVSLEALQTLVDRAETLPKLGVHPNVAQIYSSQPDNQGRSHGHAFLMEMCDESVTQIIKSNGTMSGEEVLKMLKDVVAGLEFLHGQKEGPVIHGSVYASHVLKGKGGEWKLASFGKTSFDGESEGDAKVKLDIWQLGALAFVALFGAHPFGRASEGSKAAMSLKDGCALAVPHERPRTLLEGKLCILMHWLFAPDAALRPTAKQVGVMLNHLEKMVATQLLKAMPPPVRKMVCQTLMGAERKTLVEGISSIPKEMSSDLVSQFGEKVMVNPKLIPAEKMQEVMPRAVMSRIKELYTLYGVPAGSLNNVKVVAPNKSDKSQVSEANSQATAPQPPQDLLDMGDMGCKDKEVKENGKAQAPQDLLDMGDAQQLQATDSTEKESAAGLDLLDFGAAQADVPQADSKQSDMLGDLLDMGSAPQPQVDSQQRDMPGDLFDLGSAPEPLSDSQQQAMPGDLFDMGSAPNPQSKTQQLPSLDVLDFGTKPTQELNQSAMHAMCQGNSGYFQQTSPTPIMFPQASSMPQTSGMAPGNPYAPTASAMMPPMMPNQAPANTLEATNPLQAPAPQSKPSNDDPFAFAVSNLKSEMKSGQ